jgi:hypothetical protein
LYIFIPSVQSGKARKGQWKKNEACIAFWGEQAADAAWYRARIIADDEGKLVAVFFVDYGNESTVERSKILEATDDVVSHCPQAFAARLKGVGPRDVAKEKLEELALSQSFDATVDSNVGQSRYGRLKDLIQL